MEKHCPPPSNSLLLLRKLELEKVAYISGLSNTEPQNQRSLPTGLGNTTKPGLLEQEEAEETGYLSLKIIKVSPMDGNVTNGFLMFC